MGPDDGRAPRGRTYVIFRWTRGGPWPAPALGTVEAPNGEAARRLGDVLWGAAGCETRARAAGGLRPMQLLAALAADGRADTSGTPHR